MRSNSHGIGNQNHLQCCHCWKCVGWTRALAGERKDILMNRGRLMLDVGSKHTVSYFLADGSKCN